ncbi:MAG: molybdopterin-dependent oxidoreductase [Rudaea sp.]|nr:molybdopterin-dependent oxidoreductase [Rudaea sp.]
MTRESRFRACPLCEAICGLDFQFEAQRLVAIRGDDADPFSQGHICPKGNAILDLETDTDRLKHPLRRRGNEWEEIGWDEAFALAGERLAAVQLKHGASAVGVYLGNPNVHHLGHIAYLPPLLRALKTPNVFSASSVDQWPHQLVCAQMYGHQFLLPIPDVDRTDYFLMLGANPLASMGSLMTAPGIARRLKALTARGKLVVVDPRRTETADVASEHVFIRPGTDALFLIGVINVLKRQRPPRLQGYAGKVRDLDVALAALSAFDVEMIAVHTGIAVATIERIACELDAAPRAAVYGRMGVSTQTFGTLTQWLIQLINLYTGNLDREGGVLPNDAAIPLTGEGTAPGARGRWKSRVRGLQEFAGELPVAALVEEIATPGSGQIRALLTSAGNPVLSTPDGRALEAALGTLDFMVSVDVYINETTRHADLILPPASPFTQYHYDLIFNSFAVRRVARVNAPLWPQAGDERADWEIFNALGAAYAQAAGKPFAALPEPAAVIAAGLKRGGSGLDFDELAAAPHGLDLGPLRPNLLTRLQTASGSIECAPSLLLDEVARLKAQIREPMPVDTLRLIGRREIRSNNSWMHNAARLVKGKPRHHLLMHPADLFARGLEDGTTVRMRSRTGAISVEARASETMMPGVVCLPHGFGHQRDGVRLTRAAAVVGASYNDLTDPAALDGASGNAALNGLPVWVEAAS